MLKTVMEKHGFVNYAKERRHYTLRDEPYPDTYFDFSVQWHLPLLHAGLFL